MINRSTILFLILLLTACGGDSDVSVDAPASASLSNADAPNSSNDKPATVRETLHEGRDDLVTAGLGLEGLTTSSPVAEIPNSPRPEELRRLAFYSAWTGLAALNPAGGLGGVFESLPVVSGREYMSFRALTDRTSPARVLLQVPAGFDPSSACLVLAPASGSRGVYGAVPLVAPWALPKGCAVVYTDKGAGTDIHRYSDNSGVGLDGVRVNSDAAETGLQAPELETPPPGAVAVAHAHSGDHPEADWGLYVLDAAVFALDILSDQFETTLDASNVRIIAAGLSNGGGAVLRAAEQDADGMIDAVLALMPNITAPGAPNVFEYGILAGLLQPCVLGDLEGTMGLVMGNPLVAAAGQQRCTGLAMAGLIEAPDPALARDRLREVGFDDAALSLGAVNVILDVWRSVGITYSSAYLRSAPDNMPCGYAFSATSATDEQVASWWSSHSGIPPSGGLELIDGLADGRDLALPGLLCLHKLLGEDSEQGQRLRDSIDATRANAQPGQRPVLMVHGRHDGLIPAAMSSRPYLEQARSNGATIAYWEVANAQHFDALLAAPAAAERLVPILPYGWAGLDHLMDVLDGNKPLGNDRSIDASPAPPGQALEKANLGLQ